MLERLRKALGDRYAIEGEATRGGMAIIYRAEDRKHHRIVAIKVLRPNLAASVGPERFLREIEIAARLTHPHILPLHDSGEADGLLYYVMPFVTGDSLRTRLSRGDPQIPIPEVITLLQQILDALGYAHAEGVVHRDIKPENVMLAGRNAMLIDFGIAKALSLATRQGGRATFGVVLGTPEYTSPEQAVSHPDIDHRTDIYAVGTMAYELLAGGPPFTHQNPQWVLSAQINLEPRPVTNYRQMPPYLAELVMKCLKKKPSERWQSADEILAQLDKHVPGRVSERTLRAPAPATAPLASLELPRRSRSEALVLGVFGAVAVMLIVAAIVVLLRPVGH